MKDLKESSTSAAPSASDASRGRGAWKLLLALTVSFLCLILGIHLGSQTAVRSTGYIIQTQIAVPQEETAPPAERINVNTASAAELEELPGIGPALAERIVEYRTEYGPFDSEEELLEVKGIGESKLAALEGQITVD